MHMKLSTLAVTITYALSVSAAAKKNVATTSAVASASSPAASVASTSAAAVVASSSVPVASSAASSAAAAVSSIAVNLPPTGAIPAGPIATAPAAQPPVCPGGCTWPTMDVPPPMDPAWANLVDLSKVPAAPVIGSTQPGSANGEPINPGYTATNDPYCTWQFTQCARDTDIVQCPKGSWGLTYDDGPSPYSPFLEQLLDQNQQKATRFVIGSRALEYPDQLKKMCDAGHQVAIHTYSHPYMTTMNTTTVIAELKWTERVIQAVCGLTPKYWRPPHGDVDDRVRNIATQLGYKTVIWNRDSSDWEVPANPGPTDFQPSWVDGNISLWAATYSTATIGYVTLEHELSQAEAGESVISYPIIKKAGWNIQTVADCVGDPVWYVEWANKTLSTSASAMPSASGNATGTGAVNASSTGAPATTKSAATRKDIVGITLVMGIASAVVGLLL